MGLSCSYCSPHWHAPFPLLNIEPLLHHAPPVRFEEDERIWVAEESIIFFVTAIVWYRPKTLQFVVVAVMAMFGFPPDILEKALIREFVDKTIVDKTRHLLQSPQLKCSRTFPS